MTLIVRKNQLTNVEYCVEKFSSIGEFMGLMSGMGRNKSTLDYYAKSLRTAQRWAAECRISDKDNRYYISTSK